MTETPTTRTQQSYDPYVLVDEVITLLQERGLAPERVEIETPAARITAACMLLRSLDINPARRPEDHLDLDGHRGYNRRVHGD